MFQRHSVLIVEDDAPTRERLAAAVETQAELRVVAACSSLAEGVALSLSMLLAAPARSLAEVDSRPQERRAGLWQTYVRVPLKHSMRRLLRPCKLFLRTMLKASSSMLDFVHDPYGNRYTSAFPQGQ